MKRKDYIDHVDVLTKKVREIRAYNKRIMRNEGFPFLKEIEQDKYNKMMKMLDDLVDFMFETSALSMKVEQDRIGLNIPSQTEMKLSEK